MGITFANQLTSSNFMKNVVICSVGSCDAGTREGSAEALLDYQGRTKYLHLRLRDTTANRCIIEGLIAGVKHLKEPCVVTLVTATKIGVEKAVRGKGVNANLVVSLVRELQARDCTFDFEVWEGKGDVLRSRVIAGRNGRAENFGRLSGPSTSA